MYVVITLVAVAVLVAIDQLTKWWAVGALANGTVIPVWPEVFELRYTENRGAAFGMLQNHQWLFVIATVALVAIIAALLYSGKLPRHALVTAACVLIIAGGIGNLIDRTVSGYVVDFLYFRLIDFRKIEVLVDDIEHHQDDDQHQRAHQVRKAQPEAAVVPAAVLCRRSPVGPHPLHRPFSSGAHQRRCRLSP